MIAMRTSSISLSMKRWKAAEFDLKIPKMSRLRPWDTQASQQRPWELPRPNSIFMIRRRAGYSICNTKFRATDAFLERTLPCNIWRMLQPQGALLVGKRRMPTKVMAHVKPYLIKSISNFTIYNASDTHETPNHCAHPSYHISISYLSKLWRIVQLLRTSSPDVCTTLAIKTQLLSVAAIPRCEKRSKFEISCSLLTRNTIIAHEYSLLYWTGSYRQRITELFSYTSEALQCAAVY